MDASTLEFLASLAIDPGLFERFLREPEALMTEAGVTGRDAELFENGTAENSSGRAARLAKAPAPPPKHPATHVVRPPKRPEIPRNPPKSPPK